MKVLFLLLIVLVLASFKVFSYELQKTHSNIEVQKALKAVENFSKEGLVPIAIMDLDETIINSHTRKALSYLEAINDTEIRKKYFKFVNLSKKISPSFLESLKNPYNFNELFEALGIRDKKYSKEVFEKMLKLYLTDKYMEYDQATPGAEFFIRSILNNGGFVYFVSSRYIDTQGKGTSISLQRLGFVKDSEQYKIVLRKRGTKSIDFKNNSYIMIKKTKKLMGKPVKVLLLLENEPENMNEMIRIFPKAIPLFLRKAVLNTKVKVSSKAIKIDHLQVN